MRMRAMLVLRATARVLQLRRVRHVVVRRRQHGWRRSGPHLALDLRDPVGNCVLAKRHVHMRSAHLLEPRVRVARLGRQRVRHLRCSVRRQHGGRVGRAGTACDAERKGICQSGGADRRVKRRELRERRKVRRNVCLLYTSPSPRD